MIAFLASIVAALAAAILQMALSRTREYAADKSGAEYTHDPSRWRAPSASCTTASRAGRWNKKAGTEATSSLYIVHPFRGGAGLSNLFSTHPPIEERIRRLRRMAGYVE